MKRFFAVLSVLCLCAGLFAACGGSSASYNVADVASAVESVCNIENPKEIEQDDLIYTMNLAEEDFVEFAGQQTMREAFEKLIERQTCEQFEDWMERKAS